MKKYKYISLLVFLLNSINVVAQHPGIHNYVINNILKN